MAGKRIFKIPYPGLGELRTSDVLVSIPFVRIGELWNSFRRREPRTEEEAALQELLSAIYRGDVAAAAGRVSLPKQSTSDKAFEGYVNSFKASLERAGELEVEGYFPLSGRVRFVLRPTRDTEPYRLITMRPGPQGRLRFDETYGPNKVDAVLNAIFRVLKNVQLEVPDEPTDRYVKITAEVDPPYDDIRLAVKARLINANLEQLDSRLTNPQLQFYKACLSVPDKISMGRYFQCFSHEVQSQLHEEFSKMSIEKQNELFAMTSSPRHIDFVIENASSDVVYYHNAIYMVTSRDWIERTSRGDFVLLNPLASFPLDDLLSSPPIRASVAAALKH